MKITQNPLGRRDNLVVQEANDEILIYDLSNNKAFCLNETSALVWRLCDGNKSVSEIRTELSSKLNSAANEELIWFAIDQLKKEKLIENGDSLPDNFAGLSRREIIKKIGFGAMVALPVVASMVAPTAALAQSGCVSLPLPGGVMNGPGCPCANPSNCSGGSCGMMVAGICD